MKAVSYLCFFAIAFLAADFALAQNFSQTQQSAGPTEQNSSSANYQVKAMVVEPGAGQSRSANYIYDNGTTWVTAAQCPPLPSCPGPGDGMKACPVFDSNGCAVACGTPVPSDQSCSGGGPPVGGGGDWGGGGGISSGSGSGTGEEGIGGISPEISAIDTPAVTAAVQEIPQAHRVVVRKKELLRAVQGAILRDDPIPQVIRAVDENNVVQELAMVLVARIVPWPLWLALALLIAGIIALVMTTDRDERKRKIYLWTATILIIAGILVGWITRVFYQNQFNISDINTATSSRQVSIKEVGDVVKKIINEVPIGVHRITVVGDVGQEKMQITIFVKGALPI